MFLTLAGEMLLKHHQTVCACMRVCVCVGYMCETEGYIYDVYTPFQELSRGFTDMKLFHLRRFGFFAGSILVKEPFKTPSIPSHLYMNELIS